MRVQSYVITTDRGSAPNYDAPATTLAICKPRIRKRAKIGDLIIGFNGKTLSSSERNSVRWAGVVSAVIPFRDYWNDPLFSTKKPEQSETPDNIYCDAGDGLFQIQNSSHDSTDVDRDLGGINVLVFSHVWHLGSSHEPLDSRFSSLFVGGSRRHEPLNNISKSEWNALRDWLSGRATFDGTKPKPRGRRCRSVSKKRQSPSMQVPQKRC